MKKYRQCRTKKIQWSETAACGSPAVSHSALRWQEHCHKRPVLILDDPFSALDKDTEKQIFANLKKYMADGIVIIISHRLYLFPQMNQVIWLGNGQAVTGTHEKLMQEIPEYAQLYHAQEGGSIYEQ